MVDDSFFSTYNPFNFEEQWNFGKPISAIKFGVDLDYRWIVEVGYSSNTYEVGKKVNGQILTAAKSFTSYDIQTKYYYYKKLTYAIAFTYDLPNDCVNNDEWLKIVETLNKINIIDTIK